MIDFPDLWNGRRDIWGLIFEASTDEPSERVLECAPIVASFRSAREARVVAGHRAIVWERAHYEAGAWRFTRGHPPAQDDLPVGRKGDSPPIGPPDAARGMFTQIRFVLPEPLNRRGVSVFLGSGKGRSLWVAWPGDVCTSITTSPEAFADYLKASPPTSQVECVPADDPAAKQ